MRVLCAPGLPVPPWWSIQSTFGTNQVLPSRRPTGIMLRLLMEPEAAAWAKLDSLPLPGKGGRILPSPAPLLLPSPGYVHLLMWQTHSVSKPLENHLLTKKKSTISREQQLWRPISMVLTSEETNTPFFSNPSKTLISQSDGNNGFKYKWKSHRVPIFIFKHLQVWWAVLPWLN